MEELFDVIVVGAGASGLACASQLCRAGKKFLLLEGRSRVGGRVYSLTDDKWNIPIELGAEFIHGAPESTFGWFENLHLPFYDVKDTHLLMGGKGLHKNDHFWKELEIFMKKVSAESSKRDQSISEFLKKHRHFKKSIQPFFKSFVEGFHAADLDVMGGRGLASTEEADDDELNGSKMFRPLVPYQRFLQGVFHTFSTGENTKLETIVREIHWEKGEVNLRCVTGPELEPVEFRAKRLVLTVPIGVLESDTLRWAPLPREIDSLLKCVKMGHVHRMSFRFKSRFWENLDEKEAVSFLHAGPDHYFPTWWTLAPHRVPILVAWQGGPKAQEISMMTPDKKIECALKTLSRLTRRKESFLREQLEQYYTHDWSSDSLANGAYSYIAVGGNEAWKKSVAIERTIFLAGEGVAFGPTRGTVHGAFQSGIEAANRVLKSLSLAPKNAAAKNLLHKKKTRLSETHRTSSS